jgi:hypothetical protein
MTAAANATLEEAKLLDDHPKDKQVALFLLHKLDLSAGEVAQIFAEYLLKRPASKKDTEDLRLALKVGASERQAELVKAAGGLLTSEEVTELLGYGSRQTTNNKKHSGELLAISFPNRRGDFFPRCQFDASQVQPWIPELLKRIPNGWSALAFLNARYENLDGLSWLQAIRKDPSRSEELFAAADAYVS